jgi:hypothetical protein
MPQAKCKPSKRLDIDKIRKSTVSFFRSKNSSATSCQTGSGTSGDPLSRSSTKSAPTTISTRGEESQKQIQAPTTSSELSRIRFSGDGDNVIFHGIDSTQPATSSSNNQRFSTKKIWQNRIKEWQDNISINRKITWADHGKEEFDELLLKLSAMNTQLRNVVPQLQLQNPLQKLRGGRDAPTLWNDTKLIREALGDLHLALGVVNPQEIDKELKLAVRLEENHNEGKMWMEEMGLLNGLKRRQDASFFSLMGTFRCQETYIAKKPGVFLISGTISQGRQQDIEVENLPQTLQGLPINTEFSGKSFEEIGNVSLDSQRIYSLRQIIWPEEERWLENQTLHDIIDNDAFTPKERILIAAKVAVAHIHFASVYPRFAHRQLGSYRFFRQSFETPQDWNQPFVRSSWLEYEFGSPVTPRRARLSSRSQVLSDKIDPAVELGVLLYQITSGKRLEYALTASGLKNSETAAMASIEDVEEMCATYVKEIVQACFLKTPPPKREEPNDPAFCIIEEVAAALIAQAETL